MVPLFYLLDSIIKNVSGPYIALFATHIARLYQRIFKEVSASTIFFIMIINLTYGTFVYTKR